MQLVQPYTASLIASPGPWSASTKGYITGEPILAPSPTDITESSYVDYVKRFKGKLKGKFVFKSPPRPVQPQLLPPFQRFTDEQLTKMANTQVGTPSSSPSLPDSAFVEFTKWGIKLNQFFLDEDVAGFVNQSRGDAGMVVSFGPDWAHKTDLKMPVNIYMGAEYYNQILRLLQRNLPVKLGVELEASYHNDPAAAFNITAEIQGGSKKDEVVMIGSHLDSWTGGNGATDDGAGCAIIIEAMRILKVLDIKPERTIRMALWGGHEGAGNTGVGSPGSSAYINEYFGDSANPTPAFRKLFAYFNLDNGGGKIRGIYMPQRDSMFRSFFQAWINYVKDTGAIVLIATGNPSGSDHAHFFKVGLPAFMLAQDPLDYRTRTWHSNADFYDHLQPDDMKQASAALAILLYLASMEDGLIKKN